MWRLLWTYIGNYAEDVIEIRPYLDGSFEHDLAAAVWDRFRFWSNDFHTKGTVHAFGPNGEYVKYTMTELKERVEKNEVLS